MGQLRSFHFAPVIDESKPPSLTGLFKGNSRGIFRYAWKLLRLATRELDAASGFKGRDSPLIGFSVDTLALIQSAEGWSQ
jgi:hypothetical protein